MDTQPTAIAQLLGFFPLIYLAFLIYVVVLVSQQRILLFQKFIWIVLVFLLPILGPLVSFFLIKFIRKDEPSS